MRLPRAFHLRLTAKTPYPMLLVATLGIWLLVAALGIWPVQEAVGVTLSASLPEASVVSSEGRDVAFDTGASASLTPLSGKAINRSMPTDCAEEDNINVPMYASGIKRFQVTATHPQYETDTESCSADFSGCGPGLSVRQAEATDPCFSNPDHKIFDDHVGNALWVCPESNWWRPFNMQVVAGENSRSGHRLVWIRKITDEDSWPQFLVLYEDGNLRLKPHPPQGRMDTCFGSSVVAGPAPVASRPFVDIEQVTVIPSRLTLNLRYRSGESANLKLFVDRTKAIVKVTVQYNSQKKPFATFRSMWVEDGNSDVDHIAVPKGDYSILDGWSRLPGSEWLFHRTVPSQHNTYSPDLKIRILE